VTEQNPNDRERKEAAEAKRAARIALLLGVPLLIAWLVYEYLVRPLCFGTC
jgi:hypothetical protein